MKVIGVDVYNRDTVADTLVVSGIPNTPRNRTKGEEFCEWLNDMKDSPYYYRLVEDDYRLHRGVEDMV